MPILDVVEEIDREIERLEAARKLLTGGSVRSSKNGHRMSAAARKRIGEAQKLRWAKQKKQQQK